MHAQTAHWHVSGPTSAADHELFGEIYETLHGHVDKLAEKSVGLGGAALRDTVSQTAAVQMVLTTCNCQAGTGKTDEYVTSMLSLLTKYVKMLEDTSETSVTVGCLDLLSSIADECETLLYKLNQRSQPVM